MQINEVHTIQCIFVSSARKSTNKQKKLFYYESSNKEKKYNSIRKLGFGSKDRKIDNTYYDKTSVQKKNEDTLLS